MNHPEALGACYVPNNLSVRHIKEISMTHTFPADQRNWPAIAKIEDDMLRLTLMTASGTNLLDLAEQFPDYFHDEPQEFGYSLRDVHRAAAEAFKTAWPHETDAEAEHATRYSWADGCTRLSIPFVKAAVQFELSHQLRGVDLEQAAGKLVSFRGYQLLVVDYDGDDNVMLACPEHIDVPAV
jgi:hypothetical protein